MLKTTALSALALSAAAAHAADIDFWYGNTGTGEAAIQAACAAFNEAQDDHRVTCIGQGGYETGMQKAIAAYRSGQHPALIQFFDAGTLDLMLSGAVMPVAEFAPDADWDGYITGARSYYETSQGALYSQPYNGSTLIFYGNRALLAKAGIEALPQSWEGVAEAARALKAAGVDCPFVTDGHPWRVLEQFAARHGLPVATRNNGYGGLDAEYVFNQGPVAQHLQNLADWRDDGLVKLDADTAAGNYATAFNTGECAMMEGSTGSYGAAHAALGDKVEIAMAPIYDGYARHNTLIGGASIWVMKGHSEADYDAARAFLDFLRQDEQQIEFTRATGYVPVTESALAALQASPEAASLEFATAGVGVDSLNQPGNPDSRGIRLGFYVQFRDIFMEETQKAFTGGQSMQAALDNAAACGNALLRRFEQTYQGVALP
ncbi:extracellular solute-binding protein [Mangrovicoccus ximenensis]|uniref:extracellular solute-binding protein n=1 Tax=Mangrovicoccus ximenensis TaxID=1911570 RepID=UPI000D3D37CA|nr:extracellular solute-binding protein [Mangrovicoccus ximenensis]